MIDIGSVPREIMSLEKAYDLYDHHINKKIILIVYNIKTKEAKKLIMPFKGRIKATAISLDGLTAAVATSTTAAIIDLD